MSNDTMTPESEAAATAASLRDWRGLREMSDLFIVGYVHFLTFGIGTTSPHSHQVDSGSITRALNAALWEAERRGWPEGWWEDPSVVVGPGS